MRSPITKSWHVRLKEGGRITIYAYINFDRHDIGIVDVSVGYSFTDPDDLWEPNSTMVEAMRNLRVGSKNAHGPVMGDRPPVVLALIVLFRHFRNPTTAAFLPPWLRHNLKHVGSFFPLLAP